MERRSTSLIEQVGAWLPADGRVLDVGSGTGHLAARLERELGMPVIAADVTDMHVTGRPPVLIADGVLPFDDASFSASLLLFMLHYPADPAALLMEAARVTRGPIILVQSLYSGGVGYAWLRMREFVWTYIAFHVSKAVGYVAREAQFTMGARRFYTGAMLEQHVTAAGLCVQARRERPLLPGGALVVAAWVVGRDD
ncbi:MAG: methyltransferase domain-containing protein [Gemmatimonadota bacterium]